MPWLGSSSPDQILLLLTVAVPGAAFLTLAVGWLLGWTPSERVASRLTSCAYAATTLAIFALAVRMFGLSEPAVSLPLGSWFTIHSYDFPRPRARPTTFRRDPLPPADKPNLT